MKTSIYACTALIIALVASCDYVILSSEGYENSRTYSALEHVPTVGGIFK